jgi:mRNA (guanine-N7-)-methyltransferase
MVVGVASQSLGAVRKLLKKKKEDYDDHGHVLCSCTLAVKRGDGHNLTRLDPRRDVPNSASFAHLCHLLREENAVAVLAPDKYGRFALLRPISAAEYDGNDAAGGHRRRRRRVSATASTLADLPSEDFYADLFVGKVGDAKEYLASSPPQQEEPQLSPYSPSSPIWQPSTPPALPPPDDNDEPCTSSSPLIQPATPPLDQINRSNPLVSSGLWVPPGATGHANDGTDDNLWQPPSEGEGGGGGYGWSTSAGESVGGGIDSKKRSRTEDSDENDIDNDDASSSGDYHADVGAAAADAFYSGLTRSLDTRADSRIYHMRAFNGWVKATQIQELDPKTTNATAKGSRGKAAGGGGSDQGLRLLDLACGKGGDLGKWVLHPRGISNYVGIDVARGSLRDAAIRARTPNLRSKLPRCTFTCADLGSDVPGRLKSNLSSRKSDRMQKLLSWSLQNDDPTNVTGPPKFRMVRGGGISPNDRFDVVSIQFAIHYMMSTRYD